MNKQKYFENHHHQKCFYRENDLNQTFVIFSIFSSFSNLVEKADCNRKIADIAKKIPNHDKYITTNDFSKFSEVIFKERIKQAKLTATNDLNTVKIISYC